MSRRRLRRELRFFETRRMLTSRILDPNAMNYQRQLLLPLQLLALLITLSLASAQKSNNTLDFVLTVQETLFVCENAELSWSGSNILPLYEVYLAGGNGTIGDNDSLDAEQWLAAVNDTAFEWTVTPVWANPSNVLRFRVQDQNGTGISAVAWSTVAGSSCSTADTQVTQHPALTPFVSLHTTGDVTTKNTDVATETADFITSTGTTATATQNVAISPQGTSLPSPGSQYSDQSGPVSALPTGSPGSNTGDNSPSQGSSSRVASGNFSQTDGGVTANQSQGANQPQGTRSGQQGSQSTRTAAPNDAGVQDTSSQQGGQLSTQAIGAIVGTICVATALWLCYALWSRRRRRRAIAVVPREDSSTGSIRELLAPSNVALSNSTHGPPMATAPIYQRPQILTVPLPPASGYAEATIPSYDEATSPYSPLGNPDPFRR